MKRLQAEITINETIFNGVNSVDISSGWDFLTDTCTVLIPNKFKRENKNITVGEDGFFKRGDEITVKLGYFPNNEIRFQGFIRKISVNDLITIECEDLAFKLKQEAITKSFKATSLTEFIKGITNVKFESVDSQLGRFRISNSTPAKVLGELKKTYGLISYIKDKVLRVGLAYYDVDTITHDFTLDGQGANVVSSSLEFVDSSELNIVVSGESKQRDGTIILRYAYYEADIVKLTSIKPTNGNFDTVQIPEQNEKDLDNFIKNHLENRLSTGVKGSITAFLEPKVIHGDYVTIHSRKFPEKEDTYRVKSVKTTFSIGGGGRQEIELERKKSK